MKIAIVVLSAAGLAHARRLRERLRGEVSIYGPSCVVGACRGTSSPGGRDAARASSPAPFAADEPGVHGWVGPLRLAFPALWREHDAIVAVMALGIVVRMIGPLAADKRKDPAVVAVDDAGRFAVSVLGGHGAGANELACAVAEVLGATPVVTTASESRRVPAVDRIGRELGWVIERAENLTRVAAAVVRGETVAVWQDSGRPDWWRPFGPWPAHFVRIGSWDELPALGASAVLAISDRTLPEGLPDGRTLVYRPPTLVAGVGCRRGVSFEALDAWADSIFSAHGLAPRSLAALATVTLKLDEPGLLALARARGVPLVAFPPARLEGVPGIESPSERVRTKVGIPAVSEPAALLAAGASRLLVPKQKGPGMTLALARRPVD